MRCVSLQFHSLSNVATDCEKESAKEKIHFTPDGLFRVCMIDKCTFDKELLDIDELF